MTGTLKTFRAVWREKTEGRDWADAQWLESTKETMDDAIQDLVDSSIGQISEGEFVVRSPQVGNGPDKVSWLVYIKIKDGKLERQDRFGPFTDPRFIEALTNVYAGLLGGARFEALVAKLI